LNRNGEFAVPVFFGRTETVTPAPVKAANPGAMLAASPSCGKSAWQPNGQTQA
jgi:hypothetical protein